jgi:outer membrane receptor protein involved in Fe transport
MATALAVFSQDALAQTEPGATPQRVEVVGRSPMPGLGVDRDLLPYNAQTISRGALDQAQAENLGDHLVRRIPGLQSNDIQGSTFQGDLSYRGFRASGLLGAAQGMSVFLDGVRVNESFGDVVSWDLVPEFALQSLTLQPGANPAFGLNTLGGAIALSTVDGRSAPGVQGSFGAGSFGRVRADAALGQSHGEGWHSFIGASSFEEDGWRDFSPGRIHQLFAKLGRASADTAWSVSLLGGRSTLVGNGLLPSVTVEDGEQFPDLYAADRAAVYTHPDRTKNELGQLTLNTEHLLDGGLQARGLAYVRVSRRSTVNGDAADDAPPGSEENAAFNTTATRQSAWGLAASVAGRHGTHQWQAGVSVDASRVRYEQQEQEARFDDTRGTIAGSEPAELSARVEGDGLTLGLYATDTWAIAPDTHLTTTLRLNRSRVRNQLDTVDDDTGELEQQPRESFTYNNANPAIGLAQRVADGVVLYGNIARNTRVPTAIELGCADPEEPCRLPVGLQSDPYLKPVRSTHLELGARWRPAPEQRIELALFRTDNRDDILFSSISTVSQLGYFRNFDRTRHQGLDLSWAGRQGAWDGSASLSMLDATYQATGTLRQGERNVAVQPGTPIAGLPRYSLKAGLDWRVAPGWSVGADAHWVDSRRVQGNEDDRLEDGEDEQVTLRVPGYALLHLRMAWQATEGIELVARVQNALDRHFESYGALGSTVFDAAGRYTGDEKDALFVGPGAPRSFFVGLRARY